MPLRTPGLEEFLHTALLGVGGSPGLVEALRHRGFRRFRFSRWAGCDVLLGDTAEPRLAGVARTLGVPYVAHRAVSVLLPRGPPWAGLRFPRAPVDSRTHWRGQAEECVRVLRGAPRPTFAPGGRVFRGGRWIGVRLD